MSVMLSRIDFDPQELADKEEEELAHEDAQQQQELKAFLDQELDDDDLLLDASFTPHQSQQGYHNYHHTNPAPSGHLNLSYNEELSSHQQQQNSHLYQDDLVNFPQTFSANQGIQDPFGEEVYMNGYHDNNHTDDVQYHFNGYEDQSTVPYKNQTRNVYQTKQLDEFSDLDGNTRQHYEHGNQLQVLYTARGNKIEQLQNQIEVSQEETAKEKRILQHKLTLVTSERDGMKESNTQLQSLLHEHKQDTSLLNQHIQSEQEENRKLNNNLKELYEKLQLSDSTIDSLQEQIKLMNQTESLSRARSQHESMLATMRKKHEEEILTLKEKLDDLQQALAWKVEDNNRYREMLDSNSAEFYYFPQINASRGNSQSEQASEIGILRDRLTSEENKNTTLEVELKKERKTVCDLDEQLKMFESVVKKPLQLSSTPFNKDLFTDGASLEFKTPVSRFQAAKSVSAETPVNGESTLRTDLVKALAMNREKRDEIKFLQDRINKLSVKEKELVNTTIRNSMEMLDEGKTQDCNMCDLARKEAENKQKEIKKLQSENAIIKTNMAELVKGFDREKTELYKKQNDTMLQFVDDAKSNLRDEMTQIHEREKQVLQTQFEQLSGELLFTKEEYLKLSEEMKSFENHVQNETKYHNDLKLSDIKLKLETEYKNKLLKQDNELTSKYVQDLEQEKNKWKVKSEKHLKEEIEKAVTLVKVDLLHKSEEEKAQDVELAVTHERQKLKGQQLKHEHELNFLKEEWEKKFQHRENELKEINEKLSKELEEERNRHLSYKIQENNLLEQVSILQNEVDNLQNKINTRHISSTDQNEKLKLTKLLDKVQLLENEKNEVVNTLQKSEEKIEILENKIKTYENKIKEFKNTEQDKSLVKNRHCTILKNTSQESCSSENLDVFLQNISLECYEKLPDGTEISTVEKCTNCEKLVKVYNEKITKWRLREQEYSKVLLDAQEQLQKALYNSDDTPEFLTEKHHNFTMAENRLNYILRTKEKLWNIKELSCKKDLENITEDCTKYQEQLYVVKSQYEQIEQMCKHLEGENIKLRTQITNEKLQKETLLLEINELKTKLQEVNQELLTLQNEMRNKQLSIDQLEFEKSKINHEMNERLEDIVLAEKKIWQVEATKLQAEKLKEESTRLKNNLLADIQHQTDNEHIKSLNEKHEKEIKGLKQNFREKLERISESKKKWINEEEQKRMKLQKAFEIQQTKRLSELQTRHDKFTREQQGVWERNMLQLQQEHAKLLTTVRTDSASKQKLHENELEKLKKELTATKKIMTQKIAEYEDRLRHIKDQTNTSNLKQQEKSDRSINTKLAPQQANDQLVEKMRQFYLNTLKQINEDVSMHVKSTRERAAQEIKKMRFSEATSILQTTWDAIRRERRLLHAKLKDKNFRSRTETNYEGVTNQPEDISHKESPTERTKIGQRYNTDSHTTSVRITAINDLQQYTTVKALHSPSVIKHKSMEKHVQDRPSSDLSYNSSFLTSFSELPDKRDVVFK